MGKDKTMQTLYTAKQMAEVLQIHPQTVYRLADRGEIESIKVGKSRRFLMPEGRQNNDAERTSSEVAE